MRNLLAGEETFFQRYKHFLFALYYLVTFTLYSTFNMYVFPRHFMYHWLDDYVPFMKIFIIPYVVWYFYIAFALIYVGFVSREEFIRFCIFMFGGMTLSFVIYFFFRNGQNLRPLMLDDDFLSRLIQAIYVKDRPMCSSPSMHVHNSVAVHIALRRVWPHRPVARAVSFVIMVSIILSTVCIKQHSVLDIFHALFMGAALYPLVYGLPHRATQTKGLAGQA
ncbi:MAG TPA: phosphatidic acid phosphatase [Firmicutes bacterium]|nr:phosphatidic acid phosphatase [Bacillota bacterium]